MAEFYSQAASQLEPAYNQQVSALQSQIPAIQQLYQALVQGLQGQQATGNQNILEDSSSRGLLHSTIPVQGQVQLGQQILNQQGQYAAQQAKDIGGIYSQIGGVRTDQAQAIANLANSLQGNYLQQQQVNNQQTQADREFQLQQQTANQQYQLALKAARNGY
jgi:hypothetical protein